MSKKKKFAFAAALTGAAAAAVTAGMYLRQEAAKRKPFAIEEITLTEIQKALKLGQVTSKDLVQMYLDRIEQFDKSGPMLHSFLEVNPDALHEAEACDVKRTVTSDIGPLFGVPVIVKDNVSTSGKMHTTAGSVALEMNQAAEDAFVIKQLKKAGAIILGKANLTEFANFITEGMPNGYSSLGGQVRNPYGAAFDVGGSSSGTAAAVAANLAAVGIGTETSGSIICPAAYNSVVGIKPTIGLVSRSGIVPISHSQDTAGPIARTVQDAVLLLNAIAGVDEDDEETIWGQGDVAKDYSIFLKRGELKNARLGIDRRYLDSVSDEKAEIINHALDIMREKGAVIVDPAIIPSTDTLEERKSSVMIREFAYDMNQYLENLSDHVPVHSISELIAYNRAHSDKALRYGQTLLEKADKLSSDLGDRHYLSDRAEDLRLSRKEGIDAVVKTRKLDALIFADYQGSDLAAKAGYPSITVPAGYTTKGEPIGITFVGMAFSEPRLIELAFSFEQATHCRVKPAL
ncbi:amidase family protein [Sporolactobacillus shoreicorticis]|uniref:Amidase family protein n=1 Tax=Sporolactobacillus shoreicorticis TaxID=1923877 RepID=A0ABW5S6I8_9BACL|nr:amidase family protein [Sporolactobacillus shoreicorticis]MCO7125784.1 amidase family protein [Sporolactobacillus shoreicorticis]